MNHLGNCIAASVLALFTASTFAAGRQVQAPVLPNVGIDQQLGSRLNLDLHFRDESGEDVTLGTYFRTKPVILAPVYYSCPSLCPMTMNSLIQSLRVLGFDAGKALMNERATSVRASRPTAGSPPLIASEPSGA